MFTLKPENHLIEHCKTILETVNFGNRHTANGTAEQQLTGIIGQSIIMEVFGLGYVDGKGGFDNGVDLVINSKKVDVKTMGRTTEVKRSYTNNFLKLQDYFETEIYIFCSYHKLKNEVTVCGWISKADFIAKRTYYPKGSKRTRSDGSSFSTFSDLYEIDNVHLNDVRNFEDLKAQLNAIL